MAANERRESSIRFDLFELDAKGYQLRRSGLPVDLPPQALRILLVLAARPNELVTRKEIKEKLWPDESHGDFDSRMNFAVKKLREALGDNAEQPRYVLTERKAGYRFIAPVRPAQDISSTAAVGPPGRAIVGESGAPPGLGPPTTNPVAPAGFQFGRSALLAALIAVTSVFAIGIFALRPRGTNMAVPSDPGTQTRTSPERGPEISSVSPILPHARQRIVIRGTGFGLHVPYAHTDSPYLVIRDKSADWSAGRLIPQNWDEVTLDVESWADTEIVISGFSGDYGVKGWKLAEGDELEIAVWNPQSGAGPAHYSVSVVSPNTPR